MKRAKVSAAVITISIVLIFAMMSSVGCGGERTDFRPVSPEAMAEQTDEQPVSPEEIPENSIQPLIGTWFTEYEDTTIDAFTFYLDRTGYCALPYTEYAWPQFLLYVVTGFSYKGNELAYTYKDYYYDPADESEPEPFVRSYTLEWLGDDAFMLTDESGSQQTYQRKAAPTEDTLAGYWLHNSGLYGFDAWYLAPGGKGWGYTMVKTEHEGYVFGFSKINNWYITEDYKLVVDWSEVSYWESNWENEERNLVFKTCPGVTETIKPIDLSGSDTLYFEPDGAAEPLYYLRVQEIIISADLKTARVKYLDAADYYGHSPEFISILDNGLGG